jgi:RNA polymerase sigma-70 factor (ECF subfamily)
MVLHAGAGSATESQAAMERLCRQYWYPLYVFVRRRGRTHHEAEDCTQEFLARLLAADGVARARREHGRFRTFLLTALSNFLTNEWHRAQTQKRGGGRLPVSLDGLDASERFALEPADSALTPDQAFDRSWAHGMIDGAIETLRAGYEKSGRGTLFAVLVPLVWGNTSPETLAQQAAHLGLREDTFNVALHRLRQRIGAHLRAAVAETVADGAEVEAELRHLIKALSGGN